MKKSYLESCSHILYPKMSDGEGAGVKYPNLKKYSMIGAIIFICVVLIGTYVWIQRYV